MLNMLIVIGASASVAMFLAWLWQLKTHNAAIVDVVWALGIAIVSLVYAITADGLWYYRVLVAVIGGVWYFRLAWYLLRRVLNEKEDGRYQAIRSYFGAKTNIFYFAFFQGQALLVCLFTLPAWVVANKTVYSHPVFLMSGLIIVAISFVGVVVADRQLAQFRMNPMNKGVTCRVGLWRYSRHPNYFFEWLHWFVYPLFAIGADYGAWLWLSPIVMFLFLYFITGIPYTEQQAIRSRGEDYIRYQRSTNAFFPWRPRYEHD